MKAVILAGGEGARLGDLTKKVPKPLIKIGGKSILEHQINLLKEYKIKEISICVHYLANQIAEYFGDGSKFGVEIEYSKEDKPLGTAGCIKEIEDRLEDSFIVVYGDIMVNMDLDRLIHFHKIKNPIATLVAHPSDHPYDSDLIETDGDSKVIGFLSKPHPEGLIYRNLANAGVYVLSQEVCEYIDKGVKSDFGKDVFPKLLRQGEEMYVYNTPEYLADMGTPERLEKVSNDFRNRKVHQFNLKNKRPAIFLDRDGVINKEIDLLHRVEDFELLPKAAEAIKLINNSKYLCIIVTNQPVVARRLCNISDIENVHKKMETLLGKEGAKIDAIYYCPHHPDKGYPGENPKYKIRCDCRKPNIGMIEEAERQLNVDVPNSFIIGDRTVDIMTGKNAGMKTVGVRTGYSCDDGKYQVKPDLMFDNLYLAIEDIVGRGIK